MSLLIRRKETRPDIAATFREAFNPRETEKLASEIWYHGYEKDEAVPIAVVVGKIKAEEERIIRCLVKTNYLWLSRQRAILRDKTIEQVTRFDKFAGKNIREISELFLLERSDPRKFEEEVRGLSAEERCLLRYAIGYPQEGESGDLQDPIFADTASEASLSIGKVSTSSVSAASPSPESGSATNESASSASQRVSSESSGSVSQGSDSTTSEGTASASQDSSSDSAGSAAPLSLATWGLHSRVKFLPVKYNSDKFYPL